jgi:hypothetical protein
VRAVQNNTASFVGQAHHQVEEASTMTDILLPSRATTPTLLLLELRVLQSKRATQLGSALFLDD